MKVFACAGFQQAGMDNIVADAQLSRLRRVCGSCWRD
ncbi:MAG: hypothetical protein HZB51_06475 [Chloroflexi bacterium]|nr:hypothetical protein [Chloroflexota bacterium]